MKYIKEWTENEFDFLSHISELITPILDNSIGKYTEWGLTAGKFNAKDELYEFMLYIKDPQEDHQYIDENDIFYRPLTIDFSQLDTFLTEKLIPILNKSDYLDHFRYITYSLSSGQSGRIYGFSARLGKSFTRGKKIGMWDDMKIK